MLLEIVTCDEIIGGEKPCAGPSDETPRVLACKIAFAFSPGFGGRDPKDSRDIIRIEPVARKAQGRERLPTGGLRRSRRRRCRGHYPVDPLLSRHSK